MTPVAEKLAELEERGFCVLKSHFDTAALDQCRQAFWPVLLAYLERNRERPNRGDQRHFLPMPFDPPCFEFFFDDGILGIVRSLMGKRFVADQWGCDVPLKGSTHQQFHVDYRHALFAEAPDLPLPVYMLAISFGLHDISLEDGPIEIAPGTHRMPREEAMRAVAAGEIQPQPVTLEMGDVLIRHPWALHRGTPNVTDRPRALLTIRYVRRWYADDSRDVCAMPAAVWNALSPEQREIMRFGIDGPRECRLNESDR